MLLLRYFFNQKNIVKYLHLFWTMLDLKLTTVCHLITMWLREREPQFSQSWIDFNITVLQYALEILCTLNSPIIQKRCSNLHMVNESESNITEFSIRSMWFLVMQKYSMAQYEFAMMPQGILSYRLWFYQWK